MKRELFITIKHIKGGNKNEEERIVSVILCGAMVLGMVTGCGSSKGGDSGDKVTINLYQNKSEISSQLQEAADKYTEENPNVTIKCREYSGK